MIKGLEEKFQVLSRAVQKDSNINVLYLFGSYANEKANVLSDIDLGILLAEEVEKDRYFDLRLQYITHFAEILKNDNLDVIILNRASLHLAFEVISPRKILFDRDPQRRVRFEVKVITQFFDFQPFLEIRRQYVKKQITGGTFFG